MTELERIERIRRAAGKTGNDLITRQPPQFLSAVLDDMMLDSNLAVPGNGGL